MTTQVMRQEVTLETETCCNCGVLFAMPDYVRSRRLTDGESFWCPNGHSQHYTKSEVTRLREKLDEQTRIATEMAERAKRSQEAMAEAWAAEAATQAEMKRLKRRAAAGVCPCCNRAFVQLQRHMKTKHPDHAKP